MKEPDSGAARKESVGKEKEKKRLLQGGKSECVLSGLLFNRSEKTWGPSGKRVSVKVGGF